MQEQKGTAHGAIPTFRIDTQPTKLQEYLSTLHVTQQRLHTAERVERPMSSSPPRRTVRVQARYASGSAQQAPMTGGSDLEQEEAGHEHHTNGPTEPLPHSMLASFRGELDRRNAVRRDQQLRRFLVDHRETQGAGGPPQPDRAVAGWSSTALARGTNSASRLPEQTPQTLRASGNSAQHHSTEDEVLELHQELRLARSELFAARQTAVITNETHERDVLEVERGHRLRMWSQHLSLLMQLKAKKAMLRPSQIYLESLRAKDAAEIRMLRDRVAHLTGVIAAMQTTRGDHGNDRDALPTDDERREWNELYRNLLDRIEAQRHTIDEKNALIARLQASLPEHGAPVWGRSGTQETAADRKGAADKTMNCTGLHRDVDSPPQHSGVV